VHTPAHPRMYAPRHAHVACPEHLHQAQVRWTHTCRQAHTHATRQQLCGNTHIHISNICSPLLRTLLRTQSYQGISAKHCTISNPDNRCTAVDQAVLCATCSNCPPTRAAIVNPYSSLMLRVSRLSLLRVRRVSKLQPEEMRDQAN
jgi:hypothetical protein